MDRLIGRWKDGFDWRAHEARINAVLPQFTTSVAVDGFAPLVLHFVYQPAVDAHNSIPLLFCNGWPGSFLEVVKILPLLTNPKHGPSFHVVAPSLPNFGFSATVSAEGFGLPQYAECLHKLMLQLGYERYVTQGGDWGSLITRSMGLQYPDHYLASHVNFLIVRPSLFRSLWLGVHHLVGWFSDYERAALSRIAWYLRDSSGYMLLQSSKPHTLGFALADSPVALLAWIYEKMRDWSDDYPWSDDEILTWVSIYYFSTAGPAASVRIYYEAAHASRELNNKGMGHISKVPLGISYFLKEIIATPRALARASGPVVFEAEHADGGHFAAYERPVALAADLGHMFASGGGASDVTRKFQSRTGLNGTLGLEKKAYGPSELDR